MAPIFIAAIILIVILASGYYYKYVRTVATPIPQAVNVPTAPAITRIPGKVVIPTAPPHCHKCDVNCKPGDCDYGCSKGIDQSYSSGTIRRPPGTPIIISDYRMSDSANEGHNFNIGGALYWYKQDYDQAACPAKYTGKYEVMTTTNSYGPGIASNEVCEPGCWPGECKYKPLNKSIIGGNPFGHMAPLCDPYPSEPGCEQYNTVKKMVGPGWNIESIKNHTGGTLHNVGEYQGNVYFTDYPYQSVETKYPYRYGNNWTNLEQSCKNDPIRT